MLAPTTRSGLAFSLGLAPHPPVIPLHSSSASSQQLTDYAMRLFSLAQMDFQFAATQMVDLLLRPSEIAKTTAIRKR